MQKKSQKLLFVLSLLLGVFVFALGASAATAISSASELKALMGGSSHLTDSYYLTADIDLTGVTGQKPIGNSTGKFMGTFDGKGYTIKGVNLKDTSTANSANANWGLFGYVQDGTIKNLTVEGTISTIGRRAGLVGVVNNGATIENCTNKCTVSAYINAGGILGYAAPSSTGTLTITSCTNFGSIAATSASSSLKANAGGILGAIDNYKGTCKITDCANAGSITGYQAVGGIAGYLYGTDTSLVYLSEAKYRVSDCINAGTITATSSTKSDIGGILGIAFRVSAVDNCWNRGKVVTSSTAVATSYAGGIVGRAVASKVAYCYNQCVKSNIYGVAGAAQTNNSVDCEFVKNFYKSGDGTVTMKDVSTDNKAYASTDFSGLNNSSKWTSTSIGPALSLFTVRLTSATEVLNLMNDSTQWYKHIILTKSIDLASASGQSPIGNKTYEFIGSFEGQGYTISGIKLADTSTASTAEANWGFFGYVEDAIITKLTVSGTVSTTGIRCGGLVGTVNNGAEIENCTNKCTISAAQNAGGIVGFASPSDVLTIAYCSNEGKITTTGSATDMKTGTGGILGGTNAKGKCTIHSCKNSGEITGVYNVGGIAGYYYGADATVVTTGATYELYNCLNTGTVSAKGTGEANVGGILGVAFQVSGIHGCWNKGVVKIVNSCTYPYAGGIVGKNVTARVAYCYNETAPVYASGSVQAISGVDQDAAAIVFCYFKSGLGMSDSAELAKEYNAATSFSYLNTDNLWLSTSTGPELAYFHTHSYVDTITVDNGVATKTVECGCGELKDGTTSTQIAKITASLSGDVWSNGVATLRVATKVTLADGETVKRFGTFFAPSDSFSNAKEVYKDESVANGESFSADLINIPESAYNDTIYAWAFIKLSSLDDMIVLPISGTVNTAIHEEA